MTHPDDFEDDEDEFDHFVDAQDTVWSDVLAELDAGAKRTHWMWFVFPVLDGVGQSPTALFFSLRDLQEAREYAAHPVLGPRLAECIQRVLKHSGGSAKAIFGDTDTYKLHNCATLFAHAAPDPKPFRDILTAFFDGTEAPRSREILRERGDLT